MNMIMLELQIYGGDVVITESTGKIDLCANFILLCIYVHNIIYVYTVQLTRNLNASNELQRARARETCVLNSTLHRVNSHLPRCVYSSSMCSYSRV